MIVRIVICAVFHDLKFPRFGLLGRRDSDRVSLPVLIKFGVCHGLIGFSSHATHHSPTVGHASLQTGDTTSLCRTQTVALLIYDDQSLTHVPWLRTHP